MNGEKTMKFLSNLFGKAADVTYTTVEQAIQDYLGKNPEVRTFLDGKDASLAITSLPAEYDSTPYHITFHGQEIKTVGEYKKVYEEKAKWHGWDQ